MFNSFKKTQLGRYYVNMFAKFGSLAPILVAVAAYIALFAIDVLGLIDVLGNISSVLSIVCIIVFELTFQ